MDRVSIDRSPPPHPVIMRRCYRREPLQLCCSSVAALAVYRRCYRLEPPRACSRNNVRLTLTAASGFPKNHNFSKPSVAGTVKKIDIIICLQELCHRYKTVGHSGFKTPGPRVRVKDVGTSPGIVVCVMVFTPSKSTCIGV